MHEWLVHDDDNNIIIPARRRLDRKVSKAEPRWCIEFQDRDLFRCDDGMYVPLNNGWSSVFRSEEVLRDLQQDTENIRDWGKLQHELTHKYGYKNGDYIFYKRLIAYLLEAISDGQNTLFFTCGCDYRLRLTLNKWYNEVLQERIVDLGGWRQHKDETYTIRSPEMKLDCDDLTSTWQEHGH